MVFVTSFVTCVILSYTLFGLFWLTAQKIHGKGEKSGEVSIRKKKLPHPPAVGIFKFFKDGIASKFEFHLMFMKWAKELGPIYSIHVGFHRIMMLNTVDIINKAFNEPLLNGRPSAWHFTMHAGGQNGVLVSQGQGWIEQRRFLLRSLRDLGIEKLYGDKLMKTEAEEFVHSLKELTGKSVAVNKKFYFPVFNSLWMILTGSRSANEGTEIFKLAMETSQSVDDISRIPLIFVHIYPWISHIGTFISSKIRHMIRANVNLRSYIKRTVDERNVNFVIDEETRTRDDLIDTTLQEIHQTSETRSTFFGDKGHVNLRAVMADFFIAGIDTTGTSLVWAILHLSRNPEVLRKVHEELDRVVGTSRLPALDDRSKCTYLEATIQEIMRITPVANISIPHACINDVEFQGYLIPKGSWLAPSIGTVHRDPDVWEDPDDFKPERFLSADGKSVTSPPSFIPFSLGRRRCVGEKSAKDILFLLISSICHAYNFVPDPEKPFPGLEVDSFLAFSPKPFSVVFKERLPDYSYE